MHSRVLALASLLLLALATPARAEEGQKPDFAAAKRHFKAGQEFLQMDRYADAIVEFKKAYEITKDGLVMGQVAEAYAKAGDFEAALGALKVYRVALPNGERSAADELRKEYEKAVKEGRSKKLVLPTEQPKIQPKDETTPPTKPEDKPRRKGRLWTWIIAGTAGALALSALVVGLNAQSKFDDLNNSCKPRCPDSEVDSVRTRAIVADVLWGTAAAAAVTSVVLFFVEGRAAAASTPDQKAPGEDGGGSGDEETVSKRKIRFAPVVGVGNYGLSAHIRF